MSSAEVRVERPDELALWGACHLMTELAFVSLAGTPRRRLVVLRPKPGVGVRDLPALWRRRYEEQRRLWTQARAARPRRRAALKRALELAASGELPGPSAAARLPAEERLRMQALLAEPSAGDPLGIATPWDELRRRRAAA